jgi:hypothetical protein
MGVITVDGGPFIALFGGSERYREAGAFSVRDVEAFLCGLL